MFTVSLNRSSLDPVTVEYSTSTGTAVAADFTSQTSQSITFAAGETTKSVSIATTDDSSD